MRLGFTRFLKILASSLFIQTSWSFLAMQGMGFLTSLMAGARKDQRQSIINEHKGFFNSHPYLASYIIGATIRTYDEGKSSPEEIERFITVAQTSFASSGDLLFWQTMRPALALIAVVLGIKYGVVGPIIFLLAYNIFHFYHRTKGITDGYNMGWNVIYLLKAKRFVLGQRAFEIVGAFSIGLLVALISIKTSYLILAPLVLLFYIMLMRRYSAVFVIIALLLLLVIIVLV